MLTVAQPTVPETIVGLGSDWLLYASLSGGYSRSEMLSPALVIAPSNAPVQIAVDDLLPRTSPMFFHAAGKWSSAKSSFIAILYCDPMTEAGMVVHRNARAALAPWRTVFDHGAVLRGLLTSASATPTSVESWVQRVRDGLFADELVRPTVDPRLLVAAQYIGANPEGRLAAEALSRESGLSAVHLRQLFRRSTGMTLSRYQVWQRFRSMTSTACITSRHRHSVQASQALHDAGFFDMPHGTRALQRFLGMTPKAALSPEIQFIDCRRNGVEALGTSRRSGS
ncbi:hypothetical protein [Variovorax sp. HJSM1_2]|uniref:hypothetical protein n=1 Tax=Variovorax sp. HJSM1_2 TaxID=3366263 RepID=UPI003BE586CC